MIEKLKKTWFGNQIHRISHGSRLGYPLLILSRVVQSEAVQWTHLRPEHRAHNARQQDVLATFERKTRP
ncbi:MAG: hypothetical protein AAFU63_00245 [Pseudomonadota bacterium]